MYEKSVSEWLGAQISRRGYARQTDCYLEPAAALASTIVSEMFSYSRKPSRDRTLPYIS